MYLNQQPLFQPNLNQLWYILVEVHILQCILMYIYMYPNHGSTIWHTTIKGTKYCEYIPVRIYSYKTAYQP